MDTGEGHFKMVMEEEAKKLIEDDYPLGIFKTGEIVELKGSGFRIQKITPKRLSLRLLPKA